MKTSVLPVFKDPENITSEIITNNKNFDEFKVKPITGTDGISVFFSVAVAELGESGLKTKNYQSEGVTSDTLFSADSMTKMVTAATVLRMTEEEKYQQLLIQKPPIGIGSRLSIETKLSTLLPLLKKHYPLSTYIQTELELQPNFQDITLQHLAQHTSGLARVESDVFRRVNRKLTPDEMIDAAKKPKTGEFGERIGEYFYNDLGYELLGRVIVAIDSEQKGYASMFGDVVDELVISRVKEKVGFEEKKNPSEVNLRFFTSDQMEIVEGKTLVSGHPELKIKFGKDYHDNQFREVPSHFFDLASGGGYADPDSMSKIVFHILHSDQKFSVFKTPESLEIFNSRKVLKYGPDGSLNKQGKTYGFGYESYSDPDYQRCRTHGGLGYGSNSNAFVDTKDNKVAVVMIGFENLTLPIAYALIDPKKSEEPIRLSPELYQKCLELSKNYSENQLVEMRQSLEKSYEEFKEKLEAFHKQKTDTSDLRYPKKPTTGLEKTHVEKMVDKRKDGCNEI